MSKHAWELDHNDLGMRPGQYRNETRMTWE